MGSNPITRPKISGRSSDGRASGFHPERAGSRPVARTKIRGIVMHLFHRWSKLSKPVEEKASWWMPGSCPHNGWTKHFIKIIQTRTCKVCGLIDKRWVGTK